MTKRMEEAIKALQALPDERQDAAADLVLHQLEDDRKWEESSAKYADKVARLGEQALAEFDAGQTDELDPERM